MGFSPVVSLGERREEAGRGSEFERIVERFDVIRENRPRNVFRCVLPAYLRTKVILEWSLVKPTATGDTDHSFLHAGRMVVLRGPEIHLQITCQFTSPVMMFYCNEVCRTYLFRRCAAYFGLRLPYNWIVYDRGLDSGVERADGNHRVMPEIARLAGLVAAGCLVPKADAIPESFKPPEWSIRERCRLERNQMARASGRLRT